MHSIRRNRWSLGILAAIGLIWVLRAASAVVIPFLLAVFLSLCAYPVLAWLLRRRVPFLLALSLVLSGMLLLLGVTVLLLWAGVNEFAAQAPRYRERTQQLWMGATAHLGLGAEQVQSLARQVGASLTALVATAAESLANFAMQGILVFFFLLFSLSYRGWLARGLGRAFGEAEAARTMKVIEDLESRSLHYLWLRTIVSVITAAGAWVIMAAFGVPSTVLWTVLLFAGQYVPYFGPILASVPPILALLAQDPSLWMSVWLAVALFAWGVLIGNLVEPRVMGKGLRLNELSVLLALTFFGWMWGIVGALLAVPMLVVVRIICQRTESLAPVAVLLGPRSAREDRKGA